MTTAASAQRALRALRDPERAARLAQFFQTQPGGYGEGDEFLGLTMPQVRDVGKTRRGLAFGELDKLLQSPYHEDRMLAVVVLSDRAKRAKTPDERESLAKYYLSRLDRINQWDLIDVSAPHVLGPYFAERSRAPLFKLARSPNVWRRRVGVLTTFFFIRDGEYADSIRLAAALLEDEHDLMHKAVGWMLREVGNRDPGVLAAFLDEHAPRMPRTMLRYAIEKLPDAKRRSYLAAK